MEFEFPEPAWQSVVLEPEVRRVLGQANESAEGPLGDRMAVADPWMRIVGEDEQLDDRTRAFLRNEATGFRFCAVEFALTFKPENGEYFASAWLQLTMRSNDTSEASPEPVAWSMEPLQQLDSRTITKGFKIGPDLKFAPLELDVHSEYSQSQSFLEGLYLMQTNPAWRFTKTNANAIRGSYVLRLVARLPGAVPVIGKLGIGAEVQRKVLGIPRPVAYQVRLPEHLQKGLTLPT